MFTNMVKHVIVLFIVEVICIKKPSFTTTIDKDLQEQFKATCALKSLKMNEVIETCMRHFIDGLMVYDPKDRTIDVKRTTTLKNSSGL
jgi:hypothetical protein